MPRRILVLTALALICPGATRNASGEGTEMVGRCGRDVAYLLLTRFGIDAPLEEVTEAIGEDATTTVRELTTFLETKGLDVDAKWLPIESGGKLGQWVQESHRQVAVVLVLPPIEKGQPHHAVLMAHCGEEGFETIELETEALRRYEWKTFQDNSPLAMLWVTGDAYRIGTGGASDASNAN